MASISHPMPEIMPQTRVIQPAGMDWGFSVIFVMVMLALAAASGVSHWLLLPVAVCGLLITVDAIAWMRGRLDLLDPMGLVGMVGVNFFFLAPLIHAAWDVWRPYHEPVDLGWVGGVAIINAIGLCLYRATCYILRPKTIVPKRRILVPNWQTLPVVLFIALLGTLMLQIFVYVQMGGIQGYIHAYYDRTGAFFGMGWILMICEAFPILLLFAWVLHRQWNGQIPSWVTILGILVAFFAIQLLFGGLRGSRQNTLWPLIWAVGLIHLILRPIPKHFVLIGMVLGILFMQSYIFFVHYGVGGAREFVTETLAGDSPRAGGDRLTGMLIGDFARYDVDSRVLRGIAEPQSNYDLAMGRTYIGSAAILVPRYVWPNRPPVARDFNARAMYGGQSSRESSTPTSLTGEVMLNFGPYFAPFGLILGGVAVSLTRRHILSLPPGDMRLLTAPFWVLFCVILITWDSHNLLFFLIKNGAIPLLVIYIGSTLVYQAHPVRSGVAQPAGTGASG